MKKVIPKLLLAILIIMIILAIIIRSCSIKDETKDTEIRDINIQNYAETDIFNQSDIETSVILSDPSEVLSETTTIFPKVKPTPKDTSFTITEILIDSTVIDSVKVVIQNYTGIDVFGIWYRVTGDTGWTDKASGSISHGNSIEIILPKDRNYDFKLRTGNTLHSGNSYVKQDKKILNDTIVIFNNDDFYAYGIGGTGPAGGFIFYDKGEFTDGWRYLEAAPSDEGTARWSTIGHNIKDTLHEIGFGHINTLNIISAHDTNSETNTVVHLCVNKSLNGYNDWFLPSKDELNLMYQNLHVKGLGGFSEGWYWSSSQHHFHLAWRQSFSNGSQDYFAHKNVSYNVRAIRAF